MPVWILNLMLPAALNIVAKYGIPALEAAWPNLTPIINDVIKALGGQSPSPQLQASAEHFNAKSIDSIAKVSGKMESMP